MAKRPGKSAGPSKIAIVPPERIERGILLIRGERVLLDHHLADMYAVKTKVLIQAVKRHHDRFPNDFMFQLTREEFEVLRSKSVTSKPGRGGRRYPPYGLTELMTPPAEPKERRIGFRAK